MECILKGLMLLALLGVTCAYWQPTPVTRTCCARGDPHYYLFDGQTIHYQGNCTYLLAGICDCCNCPTFLVYITTKDCPPYSPRTCVNEVEIHYNGVVITMPRSGAVNPSPGLYSGFETFQSTTSDAMKFESDEGFIVEYNGLYDVCVTIPCDYYGKMCGICGNADGIANDLVTSDGVDVSTNSDAANLIGDSYQIDNQDGCRTPRVPDPVITDQMDKKECNFMDVNAREAQLVPKLFECAERFPLLVRKHMESCLYDVAAGGPGCHILAAFVEDCRDAGVRIPNNWREITRCPLQCPEGLVYSPNVPHCPVPDCQQSAPTSPECYNPPREGCVCPTGTYRCRGRCIRLFTVNEEALPALPGRG